MASSTNLLDELKIFERVFLDVTTSQAISEPTYPSLVGKLPGADTLQPSLSNDPAPSPPSFFLKALSFTLLSFLSQSSNLSLEKKALFVAPLSQAGIPGGEFVDAAITNYQLFLKADAIQKKNYPLYTVDDTGSYFAALSRYMRYIDEHDMDSTINAARTILLNAEIQKDMAWECARQAYIAFRGGNPNTSQAFIGFLLNDKGYNDSWLAEQSAQKAYESLLPPELVDMSRQLDIIKSANDRLIYKTNNNMPCYAIDLDYVRENQVNNGNLHLDPRDIYYRPFYSLTDYERTCNNWNKLNLPPTDVTYPISLDQKDLGTWAELGHEALDATEVSGFSSAQAELLATVTASITFRSKPAVINIDRGFWDVVPLRQIALAATAPSYLKEPFMKTTKLLITKGFDIDIQIPTGYTGPTSGLRITRWGIPLASISEDQKHLRFSASGEAYPIILAVLGSLVGGA